MVKDNESMKSVNIDDAHSHSHHGIIVRMFLALLNFLKSLRCKIKSCCGCESSCNTPKED